MMSQDNQITLRGYVTANPRLRYTADQIPVADFRVGCTPRRINRQTGEWEDGATSYFRVTAWRRLAVNVTSSLHKGDSVMIRGKFSMNTWVDNEQRARTDFEIEADTVGHDLAFGWAHFLRGVQDRSAERPADNGEGARQETTLPEGEVPPEDIELPEGPGDDDWDEAAVELVTESDGDPAAEKQDQDRSFPERTVVTVG